MTRDIEFCLLVEQGTLERQAVALVESVRTFAGLYRDATITVVSPRASRRPGQPTIDVLTNAGAHYVELDIESPIPDYGPSYKVLALAAIAPRPGPPTLVQIDSDTLFCREPDLDLRGCGAAARPIDVKGICSEGPGDNLEALWEKVGRIAGVDLAQIPMVETTVDHKRVRACYNGGLVLVRRATGLFETAAQLFSRLVEHDIRPWRGSGRQVNSGTGLVSQQASEFWGTSQLAFTLAAAKLNVEVGLLDAAHNIPVHLDYQLPPGLAPCHVHYHDRLRDEAEAARRVEGRIFSRSTPEFRSWLAKRLPL